MMLFKRDYVRKISKEISTNIKSKENKIEKNTLKNGISISYFSYDLFIRLLMYYDHIIFHIVLKHLI